MFVYSVKGNTLKFAGVICLAAVLVFSLLLLIPRQDYADPALAADTADAGESVSKEVRINYNKIRTNDDRISFLSQFGWQVEPEATEEATVKIPTTFDKVLNSYNELQIKQGLDLTKYAGKEVTRYTYKITNYPNYTGEVSANIIVFKNRVIGGDVCSADVDGFIRGFEYPGGMPESSSDTAAAPETDNADTAQTENSDAAQTEAPAAEMPDESESEKSE